MTREEFLSQAADLAFHAHAEINDRLDYLMKEYEKSGGEISEYMKGKMIAHSDSASDCWQQIADIIKDDLLEAKFGHDKISDE